MRIAGKTFLALAACGTALTGLSEPAAAVCDKRNSHPECGVWDTELENPYAILAGGQSFPGTTIYRVCIVGKHPAVEIDIESAGKVITTLKTTRNASACRDISINGAAGFQVRSRPEGAEVRGTYLFLR